MNKIKQKNTYDMKNSVDFYNFCTADNNLPILEVINERFARSFRVSLSNTLRMISNISYSSKSQSFSEWVAGNRNSCFMFIVRFNSLNAPILIKLDRALSYGIIDILAGGTGKDFKEVETKEFTMIDLTALKDVADLIIADLNESWRPIEEIKAQYLRTEINSQFIGIIAPGSRVRVVSNQVEFLKTKGMLEIIYPYSTMFPVRDTLFSNVD